MSKKECEDLLRTIRGRLQQHVFDFTSASSFKSKLELLNSMQILLVNIDAEIFKLQAGEI